MDREQNFCAAPMPSKQSESDEAHSKSVGPHAWRREFLALTGIHPKDSENIKKWQVAHGLEATGVIRATTIAAARRAAKGAQSRASVGGAECAPSAESACEADSHSAAKEELRQAATHVEHSEKQHHSAGEMLAEGAHQGATIIELSEMFGHESWWPGMVLTVPAVIQLLHEGKYKDAFHAALKVAPYEKALKVLEHLASKLGMSGVSRALGAASAAAGVTVIWALWMWEGFKQLHEAHEAGNREARIHLYSRTFAAHMLGDERRLREARLSALTDEEREAIDLALCDATKSYARMVETNPAAIEEFVESEGGADHAYKTILGIIEQEGMK